MDEIKTIEQLEVIIEGLQAQINTFRSQDEMRQKQELTKGMDENKTIKQLEVIIEGLKEQLSAALRSNEGLEAQINAFRGQDEMRQKEELAKGAEEIKLSERLKRQMEVESKGTTEKIKALEGQIAAYKKMETEADEKIKKILNDANDRIQMIARGLQSMNTLIVSTFKNFQGALDNATDLYAFISKEIEKNSQRGE